MNARDEYYTQKHIREEKRANRRAMWRNIKGTLKELWPLWAAYVLIILMAVSIAGCASEPLTPEQEYARDNERILKREAMANLINSCLFSGHVLLYNKMRTTDMRRIDRALSKRGFVIIEDMPARPFGQDITCINKYSAQQILQNIGIR